MNVATELLMVEVAGYLAQEEPTYQTWDLCVMTDEIIGIAHDLDNMVLNLSEEPCKFRSRLLDLATITLALVRRIDGEKADG